MRVVIAGAGSVGRSIARELLSNGHQVLLIDRLPRAVQTQRVAEAEWLLADACEISSLHEAGLERCDVVVAATGDDELLFLTVPESEGQLEQMLCPGHVEHRPPVN